MRTPATWRAIVAATLMLSGCGGGVDAERDARGEPASTAPPAATGGKDAEAAVRFSVSQRGGVADGGPRQLEVRAGDRVVVEVGSDTADEAHLHGIDVEASVPAGGSATLEFSPRDPGAYELEMHETGALLGTLVVR